jgi:hypothetical protein
VRGDNTELSLIPELNSSSTSVLSGFENIYDTEIIQVIAQEEDCVTEEHVTAQDNEAEEEFYI